MINIKLNPSLELDDNIVDSVVVFCIFMLYKLDIFGDKTALAKPIRVPATSNSV